MAAAIFIVFLGLRGCYIYSHSWNSDETQHLHVVWGWVNGLLQYRDVFDNHTPLFQLLSAPLFALFGERADIVELMRAAMIPLFILSLWCVYKIGRQLFSTRIGLWAAVLASFFPRWAIKMGEYRTDVFWTTLWLVTLVILVSGRLTPKRLFCAGLVLGATFAVSMKSTLLLITLLAAGILTWAATRRWSTAPARPLREVLSGGFLALLGLLLIPSAIVGYYAAKGALGSLYYCVIAHNTLPGTSSLPYIAKHVFSWQSLSIFPGLALASMALPQSRWKIPYLPARLFLLLVVALFYPVLHGLWPMVTPQDFLPITPLYALLIAGAGILGGEQLRQRRYPALAPYSIVLILTLVELGLMIKMEHPFEHSNRGQIGLISDVLRLTKPGEFVMDAKGESVYRPRPYYYVLEKLTNKRLGLHLIVDDLPQRLVDTRTAVLVPTTRMTSESKVFVAKNYLPVSKLSVLGQIAKETAPGVPTGFDVVIPARYTLVSESGKLTGTLGGEPFHEPVELQAGHYEFVRESGEGRVALVWARAVELGYSPFHRYKTPKSEAWSSGK